MNYVVFYSERFDDHTYQDFSSRINKWDPKHKNQRDYSWKVLVLMTNISSCKIFLHNSLWPALAMAFGHCMMSSTKGAKVWPYSLWLLGTTKESWPACYFWYYYFMDWLMQQENLRPQESYCSSKEVVCTRDSTSEELAAAKAVAVWVIPF